MVRVGVSVLLLSVDVDVVKCVYRNITVMNGRAVKGGVVNVLWRQRCFLPCHLYHRNFNCFFFDSAKQF
jgi:hypothetical protein